jgi:hypothetical protein
MKRTQIYLSDGEAGVLRRRARASGRTVSALIREAIDRVYLQDKAKILAILERTRAAWPDGTPSGASYVERLRPGGLARLHHKARR